MKLSCKRKIPILLFHKMDIQKEDRLTISLQKFERILKYLREKNYETLFIKDLISLNVELPQKPIIITFDDGYEHLKIFLIPLLKKYKMKSTLFIPVGKVGQRNSWDDGNTPLLSWEDLKECPSDMIELGLHGYEHVNLKKAPLCEVAGDLQKAFEKIKEKNISFCPILAYPYGGYPRKRKEKKLFFSVLEKVGIRLAFRIGNEIASFPFSSPYEIKRLDISGTTSLWYFKLRLFLKNYFKR